MDAKRRQFVRLRASQLCEYCRVPQEFSELRFHVEHIVARQHGGSDSADNLALACPSCNLHKGPNLTAIDPQTGAIERLFNPRVDFWFDHFAQDGAHISGLTPIGRATVSLLEINDPERKRIREVAVRIGR
jgi:hypothetical protein